RAANLGSLGDAAFHVTAGTIRRAAVNSADRGETDRPRAEGLFRRAQLQGDGVDAVAEAGRRRTVVEDVAQVPAAFGAGDLGPDHPERAVHVLLDRSLGGRGIEARLAAVGVELGFGVEELRAGPGAEVLALPRLRLVLNAEGSLGALLAQHLVLHRCQLGPPFGLALLDLVAHALVAGTRQVAM